MKREYLGDSYDAVKRFWQQVLLAWAPLYAEPRFIPEDLRDEFTCLTCIPMLSYVPSGPFSILNDPDTGIRLPAEKNQAERQTHITLRSIRDQLERPAFFEILAGDPFEVRVCGEARSDEAAEN